MTPEEVPAELVAVLRREGFPMTEGFARDMLAAVLPAYARQGSEHDAECKRVWDEYPKLVTRLRNAEAVLTSAWLYEVLHVVWGFAGGEASPPLPALNHAQSALSQVPDEVLVAAKITRGGGHE